MVKNVFCSASSENVDIPGTGTKKGIMPTRYVFGRHFYLQILHPGATRLVLTCNLHFSAKYFMRNCNSFIFILFFIQMIIVSACLFTCSANILSIFLSACLFYKTVMEILYLYLIIDMRMSL